MATASCGDTFEVFKFHETGLVALCYEVVSLKANSANDRITDGVLWDTARYENRDGCHVIVFDIDADERYGKS
jgi:hypothetical protein